MDDKVKAAINRIQQLQQAFSENLTIRINELNKTSLALDGQLAPSVEKNKRLLNNTYDLAHKLAGSAGTFQFTEVFTAAKNLEYLCAKLIDTETPAPKDWLSQVQQLQFKIKQVSAHKTHILSHQQASTINIPPLEGDNKIILVDDDELLSALIQEQVKHFGFHISCINNPDDLSDFLDKNTPEVILMDIVFPNYAYNGIDLIRKLKNENKIQCPVIFLSNREDFSARLEGVRSGGNGYIVKPVNILELVEILDKHAHKNIKDNFRALIIDDDPIVSHYYEKVLQLHDFSCKIVSEPLTSIEALISFLPDIILLDIHMPGCSGFEVAEVIRQDNRFTHIPILFLSGDSSEECERAALKAGGNCLLDKSANKKTFIINAISQSQRSRELHAVIDRLRKDELRFQAVSHSTSDAIITLNKDGLIILWNEGAENIFGYQSIEVIGQSIELIFPKQNNEKHLHDFHDLVSRKNKTVKHSIESLALCKDGQLISVELSYSEWLSGKERFFTSIIRDITHRKEIENRLQHQQQNLNAVVTNSAEGIITISDKGIIEMVNPKAQEIFAYAADELEGQNVSILMPSAMRLQHDQYLKQSEIHAPKIINKARELQGIRKDGSVFPMELNVSPMSINGIKKYVGILHDITERKNALEAITNAKLEAEEANQAKSKFLSSMSHELRTPLNAVLGFAQLLQEDKEAPLNEDQQDSLDHIYTAGLHLLHLIDEVLDLSKIESGKVDIRLEPVNLIKLLKHSLDSIAPHRQRAQIELDQQLPDEQNIFVQADSSRLNQVISNLLTNAIKYNKKQGVISVFLTEDKDKIRIFVKDTGLGIPEEMMEGLFTPFNRLGAAHSEIEGTGIGLTITKMLTEMMGGSIGVDSTEGKGCTFWVELNRADFNTVYSSQSPSTQKTIPPEKTSIDILYIEDNRANRLLMKKIIGSYSQFKYSEATTGSEGVQAALKIKPRIILLDINLPDMDGFEVYQQLKKHNLVESTKVIIVSANAMPNDVSKGQSPDFFDYITKPIDQSKLLEAINRAIE
ncbi:MAG: response regulator [Methylococcaceae bacterium]|nr:response regulator [Methylococcaceae bacterium]